ncbi:MAG: UDP-N-acetylglucosamine 2-epimerase (non-hydrolyzing) [Planctomycetota bacterium]
MKRKILTVIGTRPEAIKLCPLALELQRRSEEFESIVCATGQHREMLDQALTIFGVKPDFDLAVMKHGQTLAGLTARIMSGLDEVLEKVEPHLTIVQGDTTSAMCGALASHYRQTLVGHVEAGLRTGDKWAPFPEEMNRRLIGQLADHHFAPTTHARDVLVHEHVPEEAVHLTGNTVIDALLWVSGRVNESMPEDVKGVADAIGDSRVVLITGHRRESFGDGFENICKAIREVADGQIDTHFVYPVHLNPRVREPVNRILGSHDRVHLIEPLNYEPFVWLMNRATVILTDSGGVQEEAPSLGKPVLVMRETTERPEGIEAGNARLVGVDPAKIVEQLNLLLNSSEERDAMAAINNPYGDGNAAAKIADVLKTI